MYRRFGKRALDLGLVLVSLPVWLSLLAVVAALVRWRLGAPVFFLQERAGRNGRIFRLIKFRSMKPALSSDDGPARDAERLTPFGRRLRASSLDELPELFNVLAGDMSLVGPRPLMARYLPRYNAQQARRHEVSPGLTGYAQVKGRNALDWETRFALDVWYVDHQGVWLDLKIVALTLGQVLGRRGISAEGEATMSEFNPPPREP